MVNRAQQVVLNGVSSSCHSVTSGVPQGSVLGPILFLIFINDLPENLRCTVSLFADDVKILSCVNNTQNKEHLQDDINNLCNWCTEWQMKLNVDKCKVMHMGRTNPGNKYFLSSNSEHSNLTTTIAEKDLGVLFDNELRFSQHIQQKVNKGMKMAGLITRSLEYLDKESFLYLFKSLVRPHIEYCMPIWKPKLRRDKIAIENVLRQSSKWIPGLENLEYEDRLRMLTLPSMSYRHDCGDMIEVFKILHGFYDINPYPMILDKSTTRGHSYKLVKPFCRCTTRKDMFFNRIINNWNSLPSNVVNALSLNEFKNLLDKQWIEKKYVYD